MLFFFSFVIALFTEKKKKERERGERITVETHEIVALQKGVVIQRQHIGDDDPAENAVDIGRETRTQRRERGWVAE